MKELIWNFFTKTGSITTYLLYKEMDNDGVREKDERNYKTSTHQRVVLRYTNFNEADRMLTLFSPELGKISVLARGCRKAKSRFLAATELFCYGEYTLYRRGDFHIMTQANILDSFYEIRNDMDKLLYASYVINLTEEVVSPGQGISTSLSATTNPILLLLFRFGT